MKYKFIAWYVIIILKKSSKYTEDRALKLLHPHFLTQNLQSLTLTHVNNNFFF